MMELARMKQEGRIEVIRERSANYHVFAFVDGRRPADELITASLEEASGPVETNHATPAKAESKSRTAKKTRRNSKAKHMTSKSKARKRR
jgi:hypothetical protein